MKLHIKKDGIEINIEIEGRKHTNNNNDGDYDLISYHKDKVIDVIKACTVSICTIINEMKQNPITDIQDAQIINETIIK